jgi:hypothetical protein
MRWPDSGLKTIQDVRERKDIAWWGSHLYDAVYCSRREAQTMQCKSKPPEEKSMDEGAALVKACPAVAGKSSK